MKIFAEVIHSKGRVGKKKKQEGIVEPDNWNLQSYWRKVLKNIDVNLKEILTGKILVTNQIIAILDDNLQIKYVFLSLW